MSDRPPLAPNDPRHGTPNGHGYWGCRCDRCCDARRAQTASYRVRRAETIRASRKTYYERNAEKIREEQARYRATHVETAKATSVKWRAENPERSRQAVTRYRTENREKIRAWRSSPEGRAAGRAHSRRRRERSRARYCGCDTRENLAAVWKLDEGRCAYCDAPGTDYEHVVPLAKGGWGCVSNFRVACKSCNSKKGTRPLAEFLERLAASGIIVRSGATNSGLICPEAAYRSARKALTA